MVSNMHYWLTFAEHNVEVGRYRKLWFYLEKWYCIANCDSTCSFHHFLSSTTIDFREKNVRLQNLACVLIRTDWLTCDSTRRKTLKTGSCICIFTTRQNMLCFMGKTGPEDIIVFGDKCNTLYSETSCLVFLCCQKSTRNNKKSMKKNKVIKKASHKGGILFEKYWRRTDN